MIKNGVMRVGIKDINFTNKVQIPHKEIGKGIKAFSRLIAPVEIRLWKMDISHLDALLEDKFKNISEIQLERLKAEISKISSQYNLGIKLEVVQLIEEGNQELLNLDNSLIGRLIPVLVDESMDTSLVSSMTIMYNGEDQVVLNLQQRKGAEYTLALENRVLVRVEKADILKKPERIIDNVKIASHGIGIGAAYIPSNPDISDKKPEKIRPEQLEEEVKEAERVMRNMLKKCEGAVKEQISHGKFKSTNFIRSMQNFIMFLKELPTCVVPYIENNEMNFVAALEKFAKPVVDACIKVQTGNDGSVGDDYSAIYENMIRDRYRILPDLLTGINKSLGNGSEHKVIVVCKRIEHYEVPSLGREKIEGIIEEQGSLKSHASISANALGVPLAFRVREATNEIENGDIVILDAMENKIIINPTKQTSGEYFNKKNQLSTERESINMKYSDKRAVTLDGTEMCVHGNIKSIVEAVSLSGKSKDPYGVGLGRTEDFMSVDATKDGHTYTREKAPSIAEHASYSSSIIKLNKGKKVILRTFDIIGGKLGSEQNDKRIPYIDPPAEGGFENSGVNVCINEKDFRPYHELFKDQIKGWLKSATEAEKNNTEFIIEYPAVLNRDSFVKAKNVALKVASELQVDGEEYSIKVKFGAMIETASAVEDIENISDEADHLSIGTNDLAQDITGQPRYSAFSGRNELDPEVINSIQKVVSVANIKKKPFLVCGEMAEDYIALTVLNGLGVKEISVGQDKKNYIKCFISNIDTEKCKQLVKDIKNIHSVEQRRNYIGQFIYDQMMYGDWKGLREMGMELLPILREAGVDLHKKEKQDKDEN